MGVTLGCPSASAVAMETWRLVAKLDRKFWRMVCQFWEVMGDGMWVFLVRSSNHDSDHQISSLNIGDHPLKARRADMIIDKDMRNGD